MHMYKIESYCLKCRKNTENMDPKVSPSSNGRVMTLSKCAIYGSKKSRFIKNQEAKGLLSKLPILGDILFQMWCTKNEWIKSFYWQVINLCLKCI